MAAREVGEVKLFSQIGSWLSDGANWRGSTGIPQRVAIHMEYSAISVAIACAIALPLGIWLGHRGRGGAVAINISNIGRAIPTYALLVLLFVGVGAEHRVGETIFALAAFGLPPLVTNTYTGVREVDADVREAARGMGMSGGQVLRRVEIPLAMPLILDGLRIAVVQVVATMTVAALVGVEGLGRFVVDGFTQNDPGQYGGGAVVVGALALVLEGLFVLLQRVADPVARARRGAPGAGLARGGAAGEIRAAEGT